MTAATDEKLEELRLVLVDMKTLLNKLIKTVGQSQVAQNHS